MAHLSNLLPSRKSGSLAVVGGRNGRIIEWPQPETKPKPRTEHAPSKQRKPKRPMDKNAPKISAQLRSPSTDLT